MAGEPIEFKCPHGVVFARRSAEGAYSGSPAQEVCTACAIKAIFGVGPAEMFPTVPCGQEDAPPESDETGRHD